jgi:hypothetical protein
VPFTVIDLNSGGVLRDLPTAHLPAGLAAALSQEEEQWVTDILQRGKTRLGNPPSDQHYLRLREVLNATRVAVARNLRIVVPALRELESLVRVDQVRSPGSCPPSAPDGILLDGYKVNRVRQAAQWALRNLGERPSRASALIMLRDKSRKEDVPEPLESIRDRRLEALRPGLLPSETIALAGAPDSADNCLVGKSEGVLACGQRLHPYWDYFVDDPVGETLRVWWEKDGRIGALEHRTPSWRTSRTFAGTDCSVE